jgi:ABC-2 type transport system ATP-binding protein
MRNGSVPGKARDILKNLLHPQKKVVTALDNVSLDIGPGAFVAYAGAYGAGKSTTLKLLSGILQPSAGSVSVLGLDPAKHRVDLMRQLGVLFGQRTELWWDHPVATSFDWKATVWNIPKETYERTKAEVVDLLDIGGSDAHLCPGAEPGQRMRAGFGLLLLHKPRLILLDEPTLGLDCAGQAAHD